MEARGLAGSAVVLVAAALLAALDEPQARAQQWYRLSRACEGAAWQLWHLGYRAGIRADSILIRGELPHVGPVPSTDHCGDPEAER